MDATIADFATMARRVAGAAHDAGLRAPSFRCPPRLAVNRTIRRLGAMSIVAVRVRGRPVESVMDDLIEGVLAANDVAPPDRNLLRQALLTATADPARTRAA